MGVRFWRATLAAACVATGMAVALLSAASTPPARSDEARAAAAAAQPAPQLASGSGLWFGRVWLDGHRLAETSATTTLEERERQRLLDERETARSEQRERAGEPSVRSFSTGPSTSTSSSASTSAANESDATLRGTVTDLDGELLSDAEVEVIPIERPTRPAVVHEEGGGWRSPAGAGRYLVRAEQSFGPHAERWYVEDGADALNAADATVVEVGAGEDLDGVDVALPEGGTIAGTVTDADGEPVEGACLEAWGNGARFPRSLSVSDADGRYDLEGRADGSYQVRLRNCGGDAEPVTDAAQWWDGEPAQSDAALVQVREGVITPGVDFTVSDPGDAPPEDPDDRGTVEGRVVDDESAQFSSGERICVQLVALDEGNRDVGRTAFGGEFSISAVSPGDYHLKATDCRDHPDLGQQWYPGVDAQEGADMFAVSAGETVQLEDLALVPSDAFGRIEGRVTVDGEPDPDAMIQATPEGYGFGGPRTSVDSEGFYELPAVHAGGTELYADVFSRDVFFESRQLDVETGATHEEDFDLEAAGAVAGAVVTPEGTTPPGLDVTAYRRPDDQFPRRSQTELGGFYRIGFLEPGDVTVAAEDDDGEIVGVHGVDDGSGDDPADGRTVAVQRGETSEDVHVVVGGTAPDPPAPVVHVDAHTTTVEAGEEVEVEITAEVDEAVEDPLRVAVDFGDGSEVLRTVVDPDDPSVQHTHTYDEGSTATISAAVALDDGTVGVGASHVEALEPPEGEPTTTVLTVDPETSVAGEEVTLTADVDDGNGPVTEGEVRYEHDDGSDSFELGRDPVDDEGRARLVTDELPPGDGTVIATFQGTAEHDVSHDEASVTVRPRPTTTELTAEVDEIELGDEVVFHVAVTDAEAGERIPEGEVELRATDEPATGEPIQTETLDADGTASFATDALEPGDNAFVAAYHGSDRHEPSTSEPVEVSARAATTTDLTLVPAERAEFGEEVRADIGVTVDSDHDLRAQAPVELSWGDGESQTAELDDGAATLSRETLELGEQTVTAVYAGDDTTFESSATAAIEVVPASTELSLDADPQEAVAGQDIDITAAVTAEHAAVTEGSVSFVREGDDEPLATAAVSGEGVAVVTVDDLPVGTTELVATYEDAELQRFESSSSQTPVTVEPAPTRTELDAEPTTADQGETVELTVGVDVVEPGQGTPHGDVTITRDDGDVVIGRGELDDGVAAFPIDDLAPGVHELVATYDGAERYQPSDSDALEVAIRAPTDADLAVDDRRIVYGDRTDAVVEVSSDADLGPPEGTVTLSAAARDDDAAEDLAARQLDGGVVTFEVADLAPGTWDLLAEYGGSDVHQPSSGTGEITVEEPDPPEPSLHVSPTGGLAPLEVAFEVSFDEQGDDDAVWELDLGDGSEPVRGEGDDTVTHTFGDAGRFTVRLSGEDEFGNTASTLETVEVAEPEPPVADAGDDLIVNAGEDVTLDGTASSPSDRVAEYTWALGDGTAGSGPTVEHAWDEPGTYDAALTVSSAGQSDTAEIEVEVLDPTPDGLVVEVLGEGDPLAGATVVAEEPDGSQRRVTTDADGRSVLRGLPAGDVVVYAGADGFRPAVAEVQVDDDGRGEATIDLERGETLDGDVDVERLDEDEIRELGLDPDDPANQHVFEVDINLAVRGLDVADKVTFALRDGSAWFIGGGLPGWRCGEGTCVRSHSGYSHTLSFSGGRTPQLTYLVVPVEGRFLKEFFDVELTVMNLAPPEFTARDLTADLTVPDGLSLAPIAGGQSASQSMGDIPGGEKETVNWVIRGDTSGHYDLTARAAGVIDPLGDPVEIVATTDEPFRVWGADALELLVEADEHVWARNPMGLRLGFRNVSDTDVYNAQITLLEETDNAIYQPRQERNLRLGAIPAGGDDEQPEVWADTATLVPAVTGEVLADRSYVSRVAGEEIPDAEIATVAPMRPPEDTADLQVFDRGEDLVLQWDAVDGAVGYEVYRTEDLRTQFPHEPEEVRPIDDGLAAVPADSAKREAEWSVSTLLGGERDLFHPVHRGVTTYGARPRGSLEFYQGSRRSCREDVEFAVSFSDPVLDLEGYEITVGDATIDGDLDGQDDQVRWPETISEEEIREDGVRVLAKVQDELGTTHEVLDVSLRTHCDYVALGDSYQSGTGAGDYDAGNDCRRSDRSYGRRLARDDIVPGALDLVACHGARTKHVLEREQDDQDVQLDALEESDPDLVTLGIGGNDLGFSRILITCLAQEPFQRAAEGPAPSALGSKGLCQHWHGDNVEEGIEEIGQPFPDDGPVSLPYEPEAYPLQTVYQRVADAAHLGDVAVVDYPRLFDEDNYQGIVRHACHGVRWSDQAWLNQVASDLSETIERRASSAGIEFVGIDEVFEDHRLCDEASSRLNGITWPLSDSFHTNEEGHAAIAEHLAEAIEGFGEVGVPDAMLFPGERHERQIDVDGGEDLLAAKLAWTGSDVDLVVTDPDGNVYVAGRELPDGISFTRGDRREAVTVSEPAQGTWRIEARAAVVDPEEGTGISLEVDQFEPVPEEPEAEISYEVEGATVELDASESTAGDAPIVSYEWDLVDDVVEGQQARHTFDEAGEWQLGLVVTDENGRVGVAGTDVITVEEEDLEPEAGGGGSGSGETGSGTEGEDEQAQGQEPEDGVETDEPEASRDAIESRRLAGANRFETAAEVALDRFDAGAETVYLATGTEFADALAGGPAAHDVGAPVLLTAPNTLPDVTTSAIDALAPERIVVLGGQAAVSEAVVDELQRFAGVERLAGANRFETAAVVAEHAFDDSTDRAYLATGHEFADAMSGGVLAALDDAPILLTHPHGVPESTMRALDALDVADVTVLGGEAAVGSEVVDAVASSLPGQIDRLAGANRFATAVEIARQLEAPAEVFATTGLAFPDTLAGVPAAAAVEAPVLLLPPDGPLPSPVRGYVETQEVTDLTVLGGPAAVSHQTADALEQTARESLGG